MLVQVIKEGIGTKGPTLSTYISIPGRYLVLMPALGRVGVSRKIEDEDVRRNLRDTLLELNPPKGLGFIVRTAGQDRTQQGTLARHGVPAAAVEGDRAADQEARRSGGYLRRKRHDHSHDSRHLHRRTSMQSTSIKPEAFERAKEFLQLVMPRYVNRLHLYEGKEPLFHQVQDRTGNRQDSPTQSSAARGGSIVIDQTEALVAIDVNSGNFRKDDNAEETAYPTQHRRPPRRSRASCGCAIWAA